MHGFKYVISTFFSLSTTTNLGTMAIPFWGATIVGTTTMGWIEMRP
jgi:hypothetical protein